MGFEPRNRNVGSARFAICTTALDAGLQIYNNQTHLKTWT